MKIKKLILLLSLAVFLGVGLWAMIYAYKKLGPTYREKSAEVLELYENPDNYDVSDPDSVADVIVKENLEKTMAANNVAAIVFDFRGFDTLGESFILLTAIAGSFVILSVHHKKKEKEEPHDEV